MPQSNKTSPKKVDVTGQRFGRLIVLSDAESDAVGKARWLCQCDCGKTTVVTGVRLRNGHTTSCGCARYEGLLRANTTHGKTKSRVYRIWAGVIQRCTNPSRPEWPYYGGRGITVCERWMSFANFHADMGDPPVGMSIDRIDGDQGYEPSNCQWSTSAVQNRNQMSNVVIAFEGRSQILKDWASDLGINPWTLYRRHRRGEVPPQLFRSVQRSK